MNDKIDNLPTDPSSNEEPRVPVSKASKISSNDTQILLKLHAEDGDLSISELADQLSIDKSSVSRSVERLDDLGLVVRKKESGKYGETKVILTDN